ncbi:nicotinate phosphoribosyltransferase [Halanaerobium saccharolyticum]|uniref:Nicotinate phosphoribosyltransferase n=1 Tax=Halanaerobium saccharolyticum TaxID=43595 RepID=A0A4R7YTR7_9FIRM|nr:nicotinate phosphoribosyltransferase [Halanaerobium saccharolyticum]RAK06502.1 nicotinate phosphoribosyltransferase [Halanaerobium saccharolyticum]TDW01046.1 nicotinate phosphoribosyltransferase [Halanaerobium saccharolyticum]TDX52627.1 nicotinate phosphoribosyltransferase [Halanaerobium saccharolyticum]
MSRDLSLLTDFYQLTMAQGYCKKGKTEKAIFDLFYRENPCNNGYAVYAGLEQFVEFVQDLKFKEDDIQYLRSQGFNETFLDYLRNFEFTGDIYSVPEGSVVFPNEPLLKVEAPILQAQLLETPLLNFINHQALIATKAARITEAAQGKDVLEFGLRRAHGPDAGIYGARAAVIGGCAGTSNVLTGKKFGVKVSGTHAHSWVMSFESELEAFRTYADNFPNSAILLVDTYDTLKSGVPNAIKVFKKMKEKGIESDLFGIRLDSGDLAYLSKEARKMLDQAGLEEAVIVASNNLDENIITSLNLQGAQIDLYGVGTKLITSYDCPAFGAVYKMSEYNGQPKIKLSDNIKKMTNPGNKKLLRIYDKDSGEIRADLISLQQEEISENQDLTLFDARDTWKTTTLKKGNYRLREMMKPIFKNGKLVYDSPSVAEIKEYVEQEKDSLGEEYKRLTNPHIMKVDLSDQLFNLKSKLIEKNKMDK